MTTVILPSPHLCGYIFEFRLVSVTCRMDRRLDGTPDYWHLGDNENQLKCYRMRALENSVCSKFVISKGIVWWSLRDDTVFRLQGSPSLASKSRQPRPDDSRQLKHPVPCLHAILSRGSKTGLSVPDTCDGLRTYMGLPAICRLVKSVSLI